MFDSRCNFSATSCILNLRKPIGLKRPRVEIQERKSTSTTNSLARCMPSACDIWATGKLLVTSSRTDSSPSSPNLRATPEKVRSKAGLEGFS